MYLLPLCEAREKHCPLTNQTCKGDMCMAWRWAELVEMEAYGAQYDCGRVYARRHGGKACPGDCGSCDCAYGECSVLQQKAPGRRAARKKAA